MTWVVNNLSFEAILRFTFGCKRLKVPLCQKLFFGELVMHADTFLTVSQFGLTLRWQADTDNPSVSLLHLFRLVSFQSPRYTSLQFTYGAHAQNQGNWKSTIRNKSRAFIWMLTVALGPVHACEPGQLNGNGWFPRSPLNTIATSPMNIPMCSYENTGYIGDLEFCDRDLGGRAEIFSIWTSQLDYRDDSKLAIKSLDFEAEKQIEFNTKNCEWKYGKLNVDYILCGRPVAAS